MSKTVIGLFDNVGEAQNVVKDLVASGIERDDIGFMANEKQTTPGRANLEREGGDVASGALAGAGTGAAIGGVAGLALAFAPLAIPGIGPIVAAGPIAAALTGAGLGAVTGGLIGGLTRLGVPDEDAHYYAEGVRRGGILVTVAADDEREAERAAEIFRRHGALDIDQRANEWKKQGWKGRFEADTKADTTATQSTEAERTVPVTEEELVVGKRNVERGGVRVYSRVIEQPVRETVSWKKSTSTSSAAPRAVRLAPKRSASNRSKCASAPRNRWSKSARVWWKRSRSARNAASQRAPSRTPCARPMWRWNASAPPTRPLSRPGAAPQHHAVYRSGPA